MHALLLEGALSGAFQEDERGPTIAAGTALLAVFDDTDLLFRAGELFTRIHGRDPYSFAARLSEMAGDLDDVAETNGSRTCPSL